MPFSLPLRRHTDLQGWPPILTDGTAAIGMLQGCNPIGGNVESHVHSNALKCESHRWKQSYHTYTWRMCVHVCNTYIYILIINYLEINIYIYIQLLYTCICACILAFQAQLWWKSSEFRVWKNCTGLWPGPPPVDTGKNWAYVEARGYSICKDLIW